MSEATSERISGVVIRFAGDSGDGMQLTGDRFTADSAVLGNDLATLPDYPAEIRAPAGTIAGVSAFQLHFSDHDIHTPGDAPDVLVAMNAAALKKNLRDVPRDGTIIINTDGFDRGNLKKSGYTSNPLEDGTLDDRRIHPIAITQMTLRAVADLIDAGEITKKDATRAKNMFALGLVSWMYSRPVDNTVAWLNKKFGAQPAIAQANVKALKAGFHFGETTEVFVHKYEVGAAKLPAGTYRNITGNAAMAYGLIAASKLSGLELFYGSYPITPASDILHELAKHKNYGVKTFQAEDEIAAIGSTIGAAFGGALAATASSGPGIALKGEGIGLAAMYEMPVIVINVQRGGPSTGLPTKTEQSDLLQAMFGRNGESPVPIVAPQSPSDCFHAAIEAARIALKYRTPVMLLSDGYLANSAEPWKLPDVADLPDISVAFTTEPNDGDAFVTGLRDPETMARPWAIPGTPGTEHRLGGIEKDVTTGNISYDPENHHAMTLLRHARMEHIRSDIAPLQVEGDEEARVLMLGWGSTYGPIRGAAERLRAEGIKVARAHIRNVHPLPPNIEEVLRRYDRILLPENNMGQLAMLLRSQFLIDVRPFNRVSGLPFRTTDLADAVRGLYAELDGAKQEVSV